MNKTLVSIGMVALTTFSGTTVQKYLKHYYPSTFELVHNGDNYFFINSQGYTYHLDDYEDLEPGDFVSVIMYDNNTPEHIGDDRIVKMRYSGWSYYGGEE